jgi:hypothetical protein
MRLSGSVALRSGNNLFPEVYAEKQQILRDEHPEHPVT